MSTRLDETEDDDSWQHRYDSAFTYAEYNDLDHMGYEAPKRYPKMFGRRYAKIPDIEYDEDDTSQIHRPSIIAIIVEKIFLTLSLIVFLSTLPLSLFFSLKFISECERLVVLRLGRAQKLRGPGMTVVLPCIDSYTKIDLRVNAFNIPPLQVITIDRGLAEFGATVFLQIKDAIAAVCAVQERNQTMRSLASTVLYRISSKLQLKEIISGNGRQTITNTLKDELGEATNQWGVSIIKVELSDVKVIKEGENMALKLFSQVMKSELGSQMIGKLANVSQEILLEPEKNQRSDNAVGTSIEVPPQSNRESASVNDMKSNHRRQLNIDDLVCYLSMVIDESLVKNVGEIFQIDCTDLGSFYVNLRNGSGSCSKGSYNKADVVFELNEETLNHIIHGTYSPIRAYLKGSLKIRGSLKSATKFSYIAERLASLL